MYKLFYAENSAAMCVRVLLEEMGQMYELIQTSISRDRPKEPALLALNPNGWIPVLITEDDAIYECGAITTYLCDRHDETRLAPAVDADNRGKFLQWLFFFSSSVQNAFQMSYYPDRFCAIESDQTSVQQRSITRLTELWTVIDNAIGNQPWMLGDNFNALDIYLFMLTTWTSREHNHPEISNFDNINRIIKKVVDRPAVKLVYQLS